MAVQLCREAVLQEAPRHTTGGRVGGYFRNQHLGNNCEIFGFTIQSQGWDQILLSFSLQDIMSYIRSIVFLIFAIVTALQYRYM